ncbi:MAG TPA: CAP domain-containing protein [Planctomycetota bacterium]|nr:CAP domain-containing protein [Planctomycetota bacterium]
MLLAGGLCAAGAASLGAVDGASNLAEEALLADDFAAAETAFAEHARDESHRARLAAILDRLAGTTRTAWQRDEKSLNTTVEAALDAQALAALTTATVEQRAAAKATLLFLFSDKQYPVPAEAVSGWRPGIDIQPGQAEMEKLYAEAAGKYAIVERAYHARLLALLAGLKPGEEKNFADDPQPPLPEYLAQVEKMRVLNGGGAPVQPGPVAPLKVPSTIVFYALRAPDQTLERVLGLIAEKARALRLVRRKVAQLETWQTQLRAGALETPAAGSPTPATKDPVTDPFADLTPAARALVALAEDDYSHAATFAAAQTQPANFSTFWNLTASHTVLIQNRNRQGLKPHENWALREINLYRISLTERPLAINDKLQTAARKHGEAMQKKKFFGHFDADPAHGTPAARAGLEGYTATVGENIAGGQDGIRSLWRWRSDAGHHRVMVVPNFCEAGLAEVDDKETLDVGIGPEADIWKLFGATGGKEPSPLPAGQDPTRPRVNMAP